MKYAAMMEKKQNRWRKQMIDEETKNKVLELHHAKINNSEIARRSKISYSTVRDIIRGDCYRNNCNEKYEKMIKIPELTPKQLENFWDKADKAPGHGPWGTCWVWTGVKNNKGYGMFRVNDKIFLSHRVSYFLMHWNPVKCVMHRCDNALCVNPDHLQEGDQQENCIDASKRNRLKNQKIKDDDIPKIFEMEKNGMTQQKIAEKFNCSCSVISSILHGIDHCHVSIPLAEERRQRLALENGCVYIKKIQATKKGEKNETI